MIRVWRQIEAVDNDGRQLSGSYLFDSDSRLVEVRDRLGGVKCASANNGPVARVLARIMLRELEEERHTAPWVGWSAISLI
jgi:hypothetical protein